ncbi:MAG: hypothetical protein AAGA75_04005 [Cyanobacteria bacterium P01_E01_bin.6]
MDAFELNPPSWTESAMHAAAFCCPKCGALSNQANTVWINRRSPVYTIDHRKKWQEFYHCTCGWAWWAWSSDRPPNDFEMTGEPPTPPEPPDFPRRIDDFF